MSEGATWDDRRSQIVKLNRHDLTVRYADIA